MSWPEAFVASIPGIAACIMIVCVFGPDVIRAWRNRNDEDEP